MPDPALSMVNQRNPLHRPASWLNTRQQRGNTTELLQEYDLKQAELRAYETQVLQQENQARQEAGLPPIELQGGPRKRRYSRRISGVCYLTLTTLALSAAAIVIWLV
ncbi:hypothetical protein GCM10011297_30680 [Bacterioplanes sanyensis]|uniref:hypothetical protein n=1 Tax=Bacterioplanes sanyensis TaxID=1249553 RepID=UPI00167B0435|nr:hypothetical protein [Bacterioplanes sanyensis]GGY55742.1 hypothetical protein GCM10011297_30680 [Bacterioplanes sanyensis]